MPPINDDVANAIELTGIGGTTGVDTTGSTYEPDEAYWLGDGESGSVWYKVTVDELSLVFVTTKNTPLPEWDSMIEVMLLPDAPGDFSTYEWITDDDDSYLQAGATHSYGTSGLQFIASPGQTYYIRIWDYDGGRSGGVLTWTIQPYTPKILGATELTGTSGAFLAVRSPGTPPDPGEDSDSQPYTYWMKITATSLRPIAFSTMNTVGLIGYDESASEQSASGLVAYRPTGDLTGSDWFNNLEYWDDTSIYYGEAPVLVVYPENVGDVFYIQLLMAEGGLVEDWVITWAVATDVETDWYDDAVDISQNVGTITAYPFGASPYLDGPSASNWEFQFQFDRSFGGPEPSSDSAAIECIWNKVRRGDWDDYSAWWSPDNGIQWFSGPGTCPSEQEPSLSATASGGGQNWAGCGFFSSHSIFGIPGDMNAHHWQLWINLDEGIQKFGYYFSMDLTTSHYDAVSDWENYALMWEEEPALDHITLTLVVTEEVWGGLTAPTIHLYAIPRVTLQGVYGPNWAEDGTRLIGKSYNPAPNGTWLGSISAAGTYTFTIPAALYLAGEPDETDWGGSTVTRLAIWGIMDEALTGSVPVPQPFATADSDYGKVLHFVPTAKGVPTRPRYRYVGTKFDWPDYIPQDTILVGAQDDSGLRFDPADGSLVTP